MHQAKGLEFPVVIIAGVEEKLLPHARSLDNPEQMEEERRLCYVGVTRAKEKLYMVHAFRRNFMGINTPNAPSRFLDDIPASLLAPPSRRVRVKIDSISISSDRQGGLFKIGDKVIHPSFGEGIIVACYPAKDDQEITIAFKKASSGIKRLISSSAQLKKA